jgi:hypothetical protein
MKTQNRTTDRKTRHLPPPHSLQPEKFRAERALLWGKRKAGGFQFFPLQQQTTAQEIAAALTNPIHRLERCLESMSVYHHRVGSVLYTCHLP